MYSCYVFLIFSVGWPVDDVTEPWTGECSERSCSVGVVATTWPVCAYTLPVDFCLPSCL